MPDSGSVWRSKEPQSRAFKDYYLPFEFGSKGDEFDVIPRAEKGIRNVRKGRTTQPG